MSLNVQNVQFTEEEQIRWSIWKVLRREGKTDLDIATKFGLKSEKQIQRLKHKAKLNGSYREWMQEFLNESHEEFWELHGKIKHENPELAYTQMGRIIERELAQKQEIQSDITVKEKVLHLHMWRPGDDPADTTGKISLPTIRETSKLPQ